jgi:hypothetical protein
VRGYGNKGVIYLTYGDTDGARNGAQMGPILFATSFFAWAESLTPEDAQSVAPIGLSFDCERFSPDAVELVLLTLRRKKDEYCQSHFGGDTNRLMVQWVIDGNPDAGTTDMIMRHADSALMLSYRNYVGQNPPLDNRGGDDLLHRLRYFMLKVQCPRCLDDDYARANYRAKISIMVEAGCDIMSSCATVSFCAYTGPRNPAEHLVSMLALMEAYIHRIVSKEQRDRLFASRSSLFAVHHFEWFSCYFQNPDISFNPKQCQRYPALSRQCR